MSSTWDDASWSDAWRTITGYWTVLRYDDDDAKKESAWRTVLTRAVTLPSGRVLDRYPVADVAVVVGELAETHAKPPAIADVVTAIRRYQAADATRAEHDVAADAAPGRGFDNLPTSDYEPVDANEDDERALYRRAREKQAAGRSLSICEALLVRPDDDLARHAATIATRQVARAGGGVVGDYVRAAFAACPNRTLQRMVVRRFEKLGHTAAAERLAVEIASTSGGTR